MINFVLTFVVTFLIMVTAKLTVIAILPKLYRTQAIGIACAISRGIDKRTKIIDTMMFGTTPVTNAFTRSEVRLINWVSKAYAQSSAMRLLHDSYDAYNKDQYRSPKKIMRKQYGLSIEDLIYASTVFGMNLVTLQKANKFDISTILDRPFDLETEDLCDQYNIKLCIELGWKLGDIVEQWARDCDEITSDV